jgi:hypothetical protein
MNQNDMDRYFWRTGQRWSSDNRPTPPLRIPKRTVLLVFVAFLVTVAMLFLSR